MKAPRFLLVLAVAASTSIALGQVIPNQYIAVFKDEVRNHPAAAQALATQHGLAVGHVYQHALKGFAFGGSPQAAAALARRPEIAYVEQDQMFHAIGALPTGVDRADVEQAITIGQDLGVSFADADITVAVLDTGADVNHPDLNVIGGIRFYNRGTRVLSDGNYADGNGHGTHVSGTIGAKDDGVNLTDTKEWEVVGVAPGVKIYAVKVLNDSGSGYTSGIAAGIDHIIGMAATIHVANMSLGGGVSQTLDDAVKRGTQAGIVFVVAAGNNSADVSTSSPAREPSAITVSALADSDGRPGGVGPYFVYSDGSIAAYDDTFAPFSNYGAGVDICAPGVCILSTVPGGGYDGTYSGTSMASPHVAGAAALFMAGQVTRPTVAEVTQAVLISGWQSGDPEYILGGDPDNIREPLLNVGRLMGAAPPPVNQPPSASFTYGTSDLTVTFTDTSTDSDGDIVSRLWNFGDGETSTDQNPSHTYSTGGNYTVTLTVTDDGGATDSASETVTVAGSGSLTFVHCGDLDATTTVSRNTWKATVAVTIHDANHNGVSGAMVTGTWSGGYSGTVTGTTGANGTLSFTTGAMNTRKTSSVSFTVGNITGSDLTYVPGANHDPDGDSTGTAITVLKPY